MREIAKVAKVGCVCRICVSNSSNLIATDLEEQLLLLVTQTKGEQGRVVPRSASRVIPPAD